VVRHLDDEYRDHLIVDVMSDEAVTNGGD